MAALELVVQDMLPLFESFYSPSTVESDLFKLFNPLLPTKLSSFHTQFVITATQLLSSVLRLSSRIDGMPSNSPYSRNSQAARGSTDSVPIQKSTVDFTSNLAASLFFDNSVLCSQFEPEVTRLV